jgi:hypothetical protein
MDPIDALAAGARRARATVDAAAERIAAAGLPSTPPPDAPPPAAPVHDVDVAEQLTVVMAAAGHHHATNAALRAALATYRSSVDLLVPPS